MALRTRLFGPVLLALAVAACIAFVFSLFYAPDWPKRVPVVGRLPWGAVVGNTALTPEARPEGNFDAAAEAARQSPPAVVFLGDSITSRWRSVGKAEWEARFAPLRAANFGVGEDRIQHLRWRLPFLAGLSPRAAVVLIGTNNLGRNTPEEIAEAVTACVLDLRRQWPACRVLVLGILPRETEGLRPEDRTEANRLLAAELAGREGVRFLDLSDAFDDGPQGYNPALFDDGVHLSAEGYRVFGERLEPAVREMLGEAQ